jgi:hypothetical protein
MGMLENMLEKLQSTLLQQVKEAVTPQPPALSSPLHLAGQASRDEDRPTRRTERQFREFRLSQPFTGVGPREAGCAFLMACDRHYEENRRHYGDADDEQRIVDVVGQLDGQAATWYNNLRASQPETVESWSSFSKQFEATFCLAKVMENKTQALFLVKMRDFPTVTEYSVEFQARAAGFAVTPGTGVMYREMFIAAFRLGLAKPLANKVDNDRIALHGATKEWPLLAEIMASASLLAPAPKAPEVHAAEVNAAGVGKSGGSVGGKVWQKVTAEEADRRGGCRFCREHEGDGKHRIWACKMFAKKFPHDVKYKLVKGVDRKELSQEEADAWLEKRKGKAAGKA